MSGDDERRAEIEAAQKRISEGNVGGDGWDDAVAVVALDRVVGAALNTFATYRQQSGEYGAMRLALAAADRVRDARNDEGPTGYTRVRNDELARLMLADAARSPQGEDHGAGIEAFKQAWDPAPLLASDERIARAIAAYLSRGSAPSPEPDTEKLVEALHRIIDEFDVTDDDPVLTIARDALARDAT